MSSFVARKDSVGESRVPPPPLLSSVSRLSFTKKVIIYGNLLICREKKLEPIKQLMYMWYNLKRLCPQMTNDYFFDGLVN